MSTDDAAPPCTFTYHCHDFEWGPHAAACREEFTREHADGKVDEEGGDGESSAGDAGATDLTAAWQRFHAALHKKGAFYAMKHVVLGQFSVLTSPECRHVADVGCGNGATALAVLTANPTVRVTAFDCSAAAVKLCVAAGAAAGDAVACRLCAHVADVTAAPLRVADACDAVCAVFVLSAVAPSRRVAAVRHCVPLLRPGGRLLIRDYGAFDMAMMRLHRGGAPCVQRTGTDGDDTATYVRGEGTLAAYFSTAAVERMVVAAGLRVVDLAYHTVTNRNRRTGAELRRVFVHCVAEVPV